MKYRVQDTVLDLIGMTPMVRLNKIHKNMGIRANILLKLEYFNAGGSVKDRIAKLMVEEAEASGRIKPGVTTLIEATSGNTGIGLALVAAVKGYRLIVTMPEKMSHEKVSVLKALGAEIVRTPTEAAWDSPESHVGVAKKLQREIPNSIILDQYSNPANPEAHQVGTGEEIWLQTGGKISAVVAGAGTGGTISGVSRALKRHDPKIKIVGVDPVGSILALPETLNSNILPYKVEGIGYDFIPKVMDRSTVDEWVKTNDADSFHLARRLIRDEGVLCGGSAGSALQGAFEYAKRNNLTENDTIVVVVPDGIRSYLTKFVSDDWMKSNGFETDSTIIDKSKKFNAATIADMNLKPVETINETDTVSKAVEIMKSKGYDQLPVLDKNGLFTGLATLGHILSLIAGKRLSLNSKVGQAKLDISNSLSPRDQRMRPGSETFGVVHVGTPLSHLTDFFEYNSAAIVTDTGGAHAKPVHVVTKVDVLEYLMKTGLDII
ncbi:cystathionine beta-synthase [Dipodascopsis uninucleata]